MTALKSTPAFDNGQRQLTVDAAYDRAIECLNAGDYEEADRLCTAILQAVPEHVAAINLLAVVAQKVGRHEQAVDLFQRAIDIDNSRALLFHNLGISLYQLGHGEQAIQAMKTALEIEPDNSQIADDLKAVLNKKVQEQAIAALKQGIALQHSGSHLEAISRYQEVLEIQPESAIAYSNIGFALHTIGRLDEAVTSYQKAISIKPDYVDAHSNLGNVLQELGRLDESIASYNSAIAINPDFAMAHNNLGNTLLLIGQSKLTEAVACFQKAIAIDPKFAKAHCNLGTTLQDQGRLEEAIVSFKRAIALQADYTDAFSNMLFCMNYAGIAAKTLYNTHKMWNSCLSAKPREPICHHEKSRNPKKRLRIGFVSGDFRKHSVSYFLLPLFKSHNRQKLAFYCYSNFHEEDDVTSILQSMVRGWKKIVGYGEQTIVDMIMADKIDILVDLSGHTRHNCLPMFARKPAPIQVTWLGYPNTTGLSTIDYRLTDAIADPPGLSDQLHVEKLARLANGFLCYQPPDGCPAVATLPKRSNGYVTFGSFNALAKLTPATLEVWTKILGAIPNSKLVIKNRSIACPEARHRILSNFQQASIEPDQLLIFDQNLSTHDHLANYGKIDIALDSFPYNGTTTTCEALWMGVPVIVLRGDRHASRVGASIMTQIGLEELIAADSDDYINKAVALANNILQLETLRKNLRTRMQNSPLCDGAGFAKNMEQAFYDMWIKTAQG